MENFEEIISNLIKDGKGDLSRLEEMLNRVKTGKPLYNSDKSYLEKLTYNETKDNLIKKRDKLLDELEKPINLEELRKSQPKPKKTKPIKFGVSYSNSNRGSAKIHRVNCHNVQRSSQEGDIKWLYYDNYPSAKHTAETLAKKQPYGWKYAGCCMRKFPYDIIFGSIITSLILGILGGLVAWYFTRDYFGNWAKIWIILGGIVSLFGLWFFSPKYF